MDGYILFSGVGHCLKRRNKECILSEWVTRFSLLTFFYLPIIPPALEEIRIPLVLNAHHLVRLGYYHGVVTYEVEI